MTCIQYNDANFRALFPAFSNTETYPLATLQMYWNVSTNYINSFTSWCGLNLSQQTLALNQMTAHVTQLNKLAADGQDPGLIQAATIDKISVTLTPPPEVTQWQWWLNQTPYGKQLLAMFDMLSAGGFFVGGYPTTFSLRR